MAGLDVVLPVQEIEPLCLWCPARCLCLVLTELSRLFHKMYSGSGTAWTGPGIAVDLTGISGGFVQY